MYDVGGESKYKLQLCGEFHEKTYFFNGKKFSDGRLSNVSGEGGGGKNIIMPRRCFNRGGAKFFRAAREFYRRKFAEGEFLPLHTLPGGDILLVNSLQGGETFTGGDSIPGHRQNCVPPGLFLF